MSKDKRENLWGLIVKEYEQFKMSHKTISKIKSKTKLPFPISNVTAWKIVIKQGKQDKFNFHVCDCLDYN